MLVRGVLVVLVRDKAEYFETDPLPATQGQGETSFEAKLL